MIINPVDHNTIYAGGATVPKQLWKSTDGGRAWIELSISPLFAEVYALVMDPTGETLYAGAWGAGIMKSVDGGLTWTKLTASLSPYPRGSDLVMSPDQPTTMYATLDTSGFGETIYKTTDGGASWNVLTSPLFPTASMNIRLAIARTNPSIVYAAMTADNLSYVFRSTDAGLTWQQMSTPMGFQVYRPEMPIIVDPANPDVVYWGGVDLYRSVNGGITWTLINDDGKGNVIHPDQSMIVPDPVRPGVVYVTNDGGIWRGTFSASDFTWTNLNANLAVTEFYRIAVSQTGPLIVLGGTQDNGIVLYTGSQVWTQVQGGDGFISVVDAVNPQLLYFEETGGGTRWFRSTDLGQTLSDITSQMYVSAVGQSVRELFADPVQQGNLFGVGGYVFHSSNMADTWTVLSPNLAATTLGLAPYTSSILYAGGTGVLRLTTDGGVSWNSRLTAPLPTNLQPTRIAVDGTSYMTAYIGYEFNPFVGANKSAIYMTTDGGLSWKSITSNMPPSTVIGPFDIDPRVSGTIFVSTGSGVLRSLDYGANWMATNDGMPVGAAIWDLRYSSGSGTWIAATYGRSVYCLGIRCPSVVYPQRDISSLLKPYNPQGARSSSVR